MQQVLIDTFIVPEESRAEFLENTRGVQEFLKTLPGFVEGYLYEKKDGANRHNMITTAVWESEEAYENARKAALAEYQRRGFNPQELARRLRVEGERGVYERSPY